MALFILPLLMGLIEGVIVLIKLTPGHAGPGLAQLIMAGVFTIVGMVIGAAVFLGL